MKNSSKSEEAITLNWSFRALSSQSICIYAVMSFSIHKRMYIINKNIAICGLDEELCFRTLEAHRWNLFHSLWPTHKASTGKICYGLWSVSICSVQHAHNMTI